MQFENYQIKLMDTEKDTQAFFNLIETNRSRLEDFFAGTVSQNKTIQDTVNYMISVNERIVKRVYFPYLIFDNHTNKIVGFIEIKNIDWSIPKAELGCFMDKDAEGKGIAGKALKLFCNFAFKHYEFCKLFLRTHESNMSSRKIVENNGFTLEGKIRMDYKTTKGEIVDLLYYGLLV